MIDILYTLLRAAGIIAFSTYIPFTIISLSYERSLRALTGPWGWIQILREQAQREYERRIPTTTNPIEEEFWNRQ